MDRVPRGLAGPPEDAGAVTAVEDVLRARSRTLPGAQAQTAKEPREERGRPAPYRVSTPSAAVTFSVCVLFSSPYVTVTR